MKPLHLIGIKTPEEKALELINKFYRTMPLMNFNNRAYIDSVKCAIICVEEILSMNDLSLLLSPYNAKSYRTFYTEVKDELLKTKGELSDEENGNVTYCAIGAISKAAHGSATYTLTGNGLKAANLIASCVPKSYNVNNHNDIPYWNDSLSETRGFTSIHRVFCKALKKSMGYSVKRKHKGEER